MNVKTIDDDNATRGNVYTIHTNKYSEHDPCKIITSIRKKETDKYENTHIQAIASS